jgi:hypothetical protein
LNRTAGILCRPSRLAGRYLLNADGGMRDTTIAAFLDP